MKSCLQNPSREPEKIPEAESAQEFAHAVKGRLFTEGEKFDFLQAVWLLERMAAQSEDGSGDAKPRKEAVRFRAHNSLSFPPSEIFSVTLEKDRPVMTVNFMGLTGPAGVLPRHYTEAVIEAGRRPGVKNSAPRDFFDLFNHRLIALFYRAAKKSRLALSFANTNGDPFTNALLALLGLGTPGLQQRSEISARALLFYAGLIAQRPCSATVLAAILEDYFAAPVTIEQFRGQWFELDPGDGTCLGKAGEGKNNQLGVSATIGDRVWDEQSAFRIVLGPLDYERMYDFLPYLYEENYRQENAYQQIGDALPYGRAYHELNQITRFLVGEEMSFEVSLKVLRPQHERWQLGNQRQHLGWCLWLGEANGKGKEQEAMSQKRKRANEPKSCENEPATSDDKKRAYHDHS